MGGEQKHGCVPTLKSVGHVPLLPIFSYALMSEELYKNNIVLNVSSLSDDFRVKMVIVVRPRLVGCGLNKPEFTLHEDACIFHKLHPYSTWEESLSMASLCFYLNI